MSFFGRPDEQGYEALVTENGFITDIQLCLEAALTDRGLSHADFARLLGVSEARISQMLSSNGRNLQARTVARAAHVLRMRPSIEFVECEVEDVSLPDSSGASVTFEDFAHVVLKSRESQHGWVFAANDHDPMLNAENKLEVA